MPAPTVSGYALTGAGVASRPSVMCGECADIHSRRTVFGLLKVGYIPGL